MSEQITSPAPRRSDPLPQVPTARGVDTAAVDAVLDEIDDVLETNAEEFVRAFVQKGGQ